MAALTARGIPAVQLDVSLLERVPYALTRPGLALTSEDGEVLVPAGGDVRGWLRRLAPPKWRHEVAASTHEGAIRAAWVALLVGITRSCAITWLSNIERLFVAENKIVQQTAAAALGIQIPASAVVSDREQIPAELGERFVAKPLGPGQFDDAEGQSQVVFATELTRKAPELDALHGAPFLLQKLLEAERHLRVVTVVDRFWVCVLEARDLPLDWRREDRAHDAFEPSQAFMELGARALELARELGVGFSSQDWIVAGGEAYFLDLNPGGQWLFLPEPVASEVTAAIAEWLAGDPRVMADHPGQI
jgi:hypothetical protein